MKSHISIGTFFAVSGTILVTSGIIFAFGPERIKRALPNLRETKEDSESDFWDVFGLYERSDTNSKKEKKEESNN